jgi:hypothetical protein
MGWAENIECISEMRKSCGILVGEQTPLRRPISRLEDNIKIDLKRNRVRGCGLYSSD